jgi:hypothetical protein
MYAARVAAAQLSLFTTRTQAEACGYEEEEGLKTQEAGLSTGLLRDKSEDFTRDDGASGQRH